MFATCGNLENRVCWWVNHTVIEQWRRECVNNDFGLILLLTRVCDVLVSQLSLWALDMQDSNLKVIFVLLCNPVFKFDWMSLNYRYLATKWWRKFLNLRKVKWKNNLERYTTTKLCQFDVWHPLLSLFWNRAVSHTIWRNIRTAESQRRGLNKGETKKTISFARYQILATVSVTVHFGAYSPEDEGITILRNASNYSPNDTHSRRL